MENKNNKKQQKKVITSFKFDKKAYDDFRKNLKKLNITASEVFNNVISQTNEAFKNGGGEVVFGIEGDDWKRNHYFKGRKKEFRADYRTEPKDTITAEEEKELKKEEESSKEQS